MKLADRDKKLIKSALIIALLIVLLGTFTACQDLGYPPSATPQPQPAPATSPTSISTKDAALLAVYEHLLSQANSQEAKIYLADFYATCDNWSAEAEFFKDGSRTWRVVVDMTINKTWKLRPYWQQASWFVFKNGKVITSTHFQANALRIEADLQALSYAPELETNKKPGDKT